MSLLLTLNKYTASGVLSFSVHQFMFRNIISENELRFASEHLRRSKHKMNDGKKTAEEKQTILLKVCNVLGKILYCIRKNFIMWDVQSHSIVGKWVFVNDLESAVFVTGRKNKNMFCTNNCFKMRS